MGWGDTTPMASTPAASPLVIQNLTTTYKFHQDEVWARLETTVRDHQDGFNLIVNSDTPLTGWILRNAAANEVIQKGGLGGQKTFTAEIPKSFQAGYRLTVFVKADQDQVPVVMSLSPQDGKKEASGAGAASIPDFEENPDHSYNSMVKSLYKQAVLAYSAGDRTSALGYLNKAADLDPAQAQVLVFRKMILAGNPEKPSGAPGTPNQDQAGEGSNKTLSAEDLGAGAQRAEANGDLVKARILYSKALRLKPDQAEWTSALDKLNRELARVRFESALKDKNLYEARAAFTKLKALDQDNPHMSDWKKQLDTLQAEGKGDHSDSDAQADQFYNMGLHCYANDDFAGAKKNWEETLKLQPNHQQAARNLQRLTDEHPELK
jgi:tetratricopeptide (TPR) repeat protein